MVPKVEFPLYVYNIRMHIHTYIILLHVDTVQFHRNGLKIVEKWLTYFKLLLYCSISDCFSASSSTHVVLCMYGRTCPTFTDDTPNSQCDATLSPV